MPQVPVRVGYYQRFQEGITFYYVRAYDYDLTASSLTSTSDAIVNLRRALVTVTKTVEDGILEVDMDLDDMTTDATRFQMATELASATLPASAPLGVLQAQAMTFYATMTEEGLLDAWRRLKEHETVVTGS